AAKPLFAAGARFLLRPVLSHLDPGRLSKRLVKPLHRAMDLRGRASSGPELDLEHGLCWIPHAQDQPSPGCGPACAVCAHGSDRHSDGTSCELLKAAVGGVLCAE